MWFLSREVFRNISFHVKPSKHFTEQSLFWEVSKFELMFEVLSWLGI